MFQNQTRTEGGTRARPRRGLWDGGAKAFVARGVWAAALAGCAGQASGQLIAADGFASTPGVPLGAAGISGTGWTNVWNQAAPGDWLVDSIGSSYHSGGWSLVRSGQRLRGTQAAMQRSMALGTPLGNAAGTVWVSYLAQQESGSAATSWLGVKLPCVTSPGVNSFLFIGKPFGKTRWGTDAGSIASHRQTAVAATTRAFVVARIDLRPGPDDVHVWINPPLLGTPSNGSAQLSLPAYGNFEGITKAVTELGSTGAPITGNLDELRIGRDYRSVAPLRDGVLFQGRNVLPQGNAQIGFAGDSLLVANIGSSGNDGVQISMDSIEHTIGLEVGSLAAGQTFSATHRTAAGEPVAREEFHRDDGGVATLAADFNGVLSPDLVSIRTTVYDGVGNVVQENTSPDMTIAVVLPPELLDLPCPDGRPRRWYRELVGGGDPSRPNSLSVVWRLGCGEDLGANSPRTNCVAFDLTFDDGGSIGPSGTGDEGYMVVRSNLGDFSQLRAAGRYHDLPATGIREVELIERCTDGTSCPDADARELTIDGNGGVEFDLDGVEPVTSVKHSSGMSATRQPPRSVGTSSVPRGSTRSPAASARASCCNRTGWAAAPRS